MDILHRWFRALLCFADLVLSRRIRELERVTVEFASGNFKARASTASAKSVGTLNKSFNNMADKVSRLITSNKMLTNAVAHELRTPIFACNGRLIYSPTL